MDLSYSDVLKILASANHVPDEAIPAFRARLRHLQRQGFPQGINTGRGKPAKYSPKQVFELAFAVELAQFGIGPERIVGIVENNALSLAVIVATFLDDRSNQDEGDYFLVFVPALFLPGGNDYGIMGMSKSADLGAVISRMQGVNCDHVGIINVSNVVKKITPKERASEFLTDLHASMSEASRAEASRIETAFHKVFGQGRGNGINP